TVMAPPLLLPPVEEPLSATPEAATLLPAVSEMIPPAAPVVSTRLFARVSEILCPALAVKPLPDVAIPPTDVVTDILPCVASESAPAPLAFNVSPPPVTARLEPLIVMLPLLFPDVPLADNVMPPDAVIVPPPRAVAVKVILPPAPLVTPTLMEEFVTVIPPLVTLPRLMTETEPPSPEVP